MRDEAQDRWFGTGAMIWRRAAALLMGVALAVSLAALLSGGCSDDEDCPVCPTPSVEIERVHPQPESTSVGDTLHLWAIGYGTGLSFRWIADSGEILIDGGSYAKWKAPSSPMISKVTVVAFNENESSSASISIPVGSYVPMHEPTYTGAAYCGLECHGSNGHEDLYTTWLETPHAQTFARVAGELDEDPTCVDCHAVGTTDVNESGWVRHNGGFDEVPTEKLQGVQCESCHGPLADLDGQIRTDHAALGVGDSLLLAVGTPGALLGCGRCHEAADAGASDRVSEWSASAHAVSHLASEEGVGAGDPSCAGCHTAQGFVARMTGAAAPATTLEAPLPITCAACHDPHDASHHASLRRDLRDDVCRQCHTDEAHAELATPHAPHAQMFAATGGYEYGEVLGSSPHSNIATEGCATCHNSSAEGAIRHTFTADPLSCAACHPESDNSSDYGWSDPMAEVRSLFNLLVWDLDHTPEEFHETPEYQRALFNKEFIERDGSTGAHNYLYAKRLLELAREDLSQLR